MPFEAAGGKLRIWRGIGDTRGGGETLIVRVRRASRCAALFRILAVLSKEVLGGEEGQKWPGGGLSSNLLGIIGW